MANIFQINVIGYRSNTFIANLLNTKHFKMKILLKKILLIALEGGDNIFRICCVLFIHILERGDCKFCTRIVLATRCPGDGGCKISTFWLDFRLSNAGKGLLVFFFNNDSKKNTWMEMYRLFC